MKKYFNKFIKEVGIYSIALLGFISCNKNYTNPAAASSSQVLSSVTGITGVASGLQNWYTTNRGGLVYNMITSSGLLTNEIYVVNSGNTDEAQLGTGAGAVQNTNNIVTGMWTVANKVVYDADNIINNISIVPDKGYASGLIAYTSIFKAMAIGDMAMFWDHVPDTVGLNVNFVTSTAGYNKAIAIINNALSVIAATPISSAFLSSIPAGIDIPNTLYALKARYSLFAGNYADALSAANAVNLTAKSVFNYSSTYSNPIYATATSTNNVFQSTDSTLGLPVGLQPNLADKRVAFYTTISSNPRFRINGFFSGVTQAIPIYLPGEIMLIKAECYAQQNDLVNGYAQLNNVLTKTAAADPFGVGAGLTAASVISQTDLLNQIYQNRCIELYMSGLKLADEKRFNRATTERKRSFLPYPFVERNANSNTPSDPAF